MLFIVKDLVYQQQWHQKTHGYVKIWNYNYDYSLAINPVVVVGYS